MAGYGNAYVDENDPRDVCGADTAHATDHVIRCSPDPVLTHDNITSVACRRCRCGKHTYHEFGCTAGKGPKVTREMHNEFHKSVKKIVEPKIEAVEKSARKKALEQMSDKYSLRADQREALLSGGWD